MEANKNQGRLIEIVTLAKSYCDLCENALSYNKSEFIDRALDLLPRLYWNFFDIETSGISLDEYDYFSSYVDEEFYENIRSHIAGLIGGDDIFLETFEEDMRYSETPISASISENMADIFQPLFNFISIVRDSEGSQMEDAYISCKEEFESYWSQSLCNVLKALNNLKYGNRIIEDYD